MKKTTLVVLILFMLALVTPASAARELPVVGEQICIHSDCTPPETFLAGDPFYIRHGWLWDAGNNRGLGIWDFNLLLDGVPVADGIRYIVAPSDGLHGSITRIYNFPEGLPAGEYTFTGLWIITCQSGPNPSECATPNEPVIGGVNEVTIIFTAP